MYELYEMYVSKIWKDDETSICLFKIEGTAEHKFKYRLTILDTGRIPDVVTSKLTNIWAKEFTAVYDRKTGLSKLCKTYKNVEKELQRLRDNGIVFSLETEMKVAKGVPDEYR